jgi:hypothetical protein
VYTGELVKLAVVGLSVVVVVLGVSRGAESTATAAANEDPREVQGRTLFAKGEYEAALDIYATLFAERADPLYLRNIGRCNQKLRRPDRAIDAFREYIRRTKRMKASEREEVEGFIHEMVELKAEMERAEHEKAAHPAPADEARDRAPAAEPAAAAPAPPPAPPSPPPVAVASEPAAAPPAPDAPDAARSAADPSPAAAVASQASPAPQAGQAGRLFLSVTAGTGFGIASGTGEINPMHKISASGFAPAQLGHVAPEMGFFVTPRLLASAQLRAQYVIWLTSQQVPGLGCPSDYCQASSVALAGFGRLAWLIGDGRVRLLPGLLAGGGNISHAVVFPKDRTCGTPPTIECVDSVPSGPFFVGPSIELVVELGDVVGLVAAVNTEVGVPHFTLNFDFNAGLALRL